MSKYGLGIVAGLGVALGALAGCNIEAGDCGPGKKGQFGQDWTQEDEDCVPFCNRLMTCGLVGADREDDCLDFCRKQHVANDSQTHTGCQCVISDSCRTPSTYQCPGAPIPPPDYHATSGSSGSTGTWTTTTTSGGTSGGSSGTTSATTTGGSSGGSTGGTTGSAGQCTRNLDCAYNQDCVNGECMNRCHASCECASGQTCVNGYCASNLPPPQSCTVDCECNAGQHCVNGACQ